MRGRIGTRTIAWGSALGACLAFTLVTAAPQASARELKVISDRTVGGFGHNESVAYEPNEKVLYASDFGPALKPADKDGQGKIVKISLDGKILDPHFLPAAGQVLNKPKGVWIKGNRLWVTDIDAVWEFDLKTKEGKKLDLPGITYANDPAIMGNALYVSDNRNDKLARVEPADFLKAKAAPKVTIVFSGKGVFPNGLWPARDGSLLMVGFQAKDKPQAIYSLRPGQDPKPISEKIGMLDGLYQMKDGDLIATDWVTESVFHWNKKTGVQKLATGIKGPADLCAIPNKQGLLVIVPDLVKGELRFLQLGS